MPPPVYTARLHAAAHTTDYLYHQLIPYLGNKRKLLPLIARAVQATGVRDGTFLDFFAGSGVVARWAKQEGFRTLANDWEPYAEVLNGCSIRCNCPPTFAGFGGMDNAFAALNGVIPEVGYLTTQLCPADDACPDFDTERLFFTRANGMRLDAMRELIASWEMRGQISEDERTVLLASLLYAASYVSNTSGVFKAFHRGWGGRTGTALYRILSTVRLLPPIFFDNDRDNRVTRMDAQALAEGMRNEPVDIAYLDPPYNQHPYGSNYHVLNTITHWDKPAVTPRMKSAIRTDWRTERRSAYNHRATALVAFRILLHTIKARFILTSYSTDGTIALPDLLTAAAERGQVRCLAHPYKRYRVSAQRRSEKPVNIEFVLIVDTTRPSQPRDVAAIGAMLAAAEAGALAEHRERAM